MAAYLIRRVGQSVVLLLLVTVVTFLLIHKAPGGPSILLSPDTPRDQQKQIAENLGLNDPLPVQYARWFKGLVRLDLGVSYTQSRDVTNVIRTRLPATLVLAGGSFLLAILVAIPLGILAAVRRNSIFDHIAAFISLFGVAVPVFWYGILLIILCSVWLRILP